MEALLTLVSTVHEIHCMKAAASRRTAVLEEGYSPFITSTCNTPEENQTSAQSLSNVSLFFEQWSQVRQRPESSIPRQGSILSEYVIYINFCPMKYDISIRY